MMMMMIICFIIIVQVSPGSVFVPLVNHVNLRYNLPQIITSSRSHIDTEAKQSNASTCTDSFTVTSLDPVDYAPYQHLATFL